MRTFLDTFYRLRFNACICTLMLAPHLSAAATLTFTPNAGRKDISVEIAGFSGAGTLYCQIGDRQPVPTALDAKNDLKSDLKLPCGGRLARGQMVTVELKDSSDVLVASQSNPVLDSSGKHSAKAQPQTVSLAADGANAIRLTVFGPKPSDPSKITVYDSRMNNITSGVPTALPDGGFHISLNAAPRLSERVTVMVDGTPHSAAVGSPTDSGKVTVELTPQPKDTQTTITGMLSGQTATLARVQAVYVEVLNGVDGNGDVVQGPIDGKYNTATYAFSVTGLKALAEGQTVHVHVCGAPIPVLFKGDLTKDSAVITNIPSTSALLAGGGVTGTNIPASATINSVDSASQITISQEASAVATGSDLQFLSGPSCAQAGPQGSGGSSTAKAALVEIAADKATAEVTSLYDLGRMKTYFSVGAEFQGTNGALGTTSGYASVNIDENWITTGPDTKAKCFSASDSSTFRENNGDTHNCGAHPFRFLLNTYVEAELTQIPLTTSTANTTSSGTQGTSQVARAAAAAGGTTTTGSTSTSTFDISKAKGAYVEGGVYAPLLLPSMQWSFHGQENAFFFAPIAKYAFLEPDSSPAGSTTSFNTYRAYSSGFRWGHFRLPSHFAKQGPELLSYVDVTWGRWENYREANGSRGTRMDVNGRYKIPYTLLYLGFEANVGPGGSDFRLFAGTRVDVSSIIGKLLPSTN